MTDLAAALRLVEVMVLAASLPLACIAAWGYRSAPVGRAVAALPLVSAGFLLAAVTELLGGAGPGEPITWYAGIAVGVAALAWFAGNFLHLASGRRAVGQ